MTDRGTTAQRDRDRARIRRTGAACHICGDPIDYSLRSPDPGSYELDHVVALNRGGANTIGNLAACHRRCNRAKSDKAHAPIVRRSGSLG